MDVEWTGVYDLRCQRGMRNNVWEINHSEITHSIVYRNVSRVVIDHVTLPGWLTENFLQNNKISLNFKSLAILSYIR